MTFVCPDCEARALEIGDSLELPPDADDDEITLQTVVCAQCGLQAVAVYRESRRGALDSEAWRHEGYRVAEKDFRDIRASIRRCPAPRDNRCPCPTHTRLGLRSGTRWDGLRLSGIDVHGVFEMRL